MNSRDRSLWNLRTNQDKVRLPKGSPREFIAPFSLFRKNKSFTLVELIVVVLVMGALAALAIPKITMMIQTTVERDAVTRLNVIASLVKIYKTKNGTFPPVMNNVTQINAALGSQLRDTTDLTFSCLNRYGNNSECQAVSSAGWSLHFEDLYQVSGKPYFYVPHCLSSWLGGKACPTCDQTSCSGY